VPRIRTTFRALGKPPRKLDQRLQFNQPALLILSSQEIEGSVVGYSPDVFSAFEITFESTK
jgi:hypothetical protein